MAGLSTLQVIALLTPLVLIELGLKLVALLDLEKEDRRVRGGNKIAWALVILLVSTIGPIGYLLIGRLED